MPEITQGHLTSPSWQLTITGRIGVSQWSKLPPKSKPRSVAARPVQPATPVGVHFQRHRKAGQLTKWYVYAFRGGPRIKIAHGEQKPFLTSEDIRKINEERYRRDNPEVRGPEVLTLSGLAEAWRASKAWQDLAKNTKRTWGSNLGAILREFGNHPAVLFYDNRMVEHIYEWRKRLAKHPRAADSKISVLRSLLAFGGILLSKTENIAAGIPKLYAGNTRPEIIWTHADIARFVAAAREGGQPALAMALLLAAETGLRRADLVKVKHSNIKDGVITLQASKPSRGKKRLVSIPVSPSLGALLQDIKGLGRNHGATTILVDDAGHPWDGDRLTKAVERLRNKLSIVHISKADGRKPVRRAKTLHDLRGTFATKLVLLGHSDADIADVMGWAPEKVRRIRNTYVPQGMKAQAMAARMRGGVVSL
jgi:integrase